ncbi:MAG: 1-acyl-sn-glycerol-3-phosphate acyltransferase [Proteobacteria bacterium]|nr:1-acyl-sn-glycerol-3-phosphate acyltransferase [Pseudomonadota bacterium]MBK7115583.1 1-acyl-sn-glycerol-3-phosphate acyltransferase [Pseudomonadota bacterium]MBK9250955.1 1-acyl-sn-glycerol-3-phosphate acyltransferase [Pseudomonadota bacterium]MCC6632943.1 1-acyl-sn-glycerol-3-phosphate acyltransferase [Gammaproteobacteria bacterium]
MSPSEDLPTVQRPHALRHLYAAYALAAFGLLAVVALLLILPVPWLALRRRIARRFARIALAACGMRLSVMHPERLGPEPCIVVANHCSYLDGIVLYAALPPTFGFVIKREMSRVPLANLLLRRIGAHYVDRNRGAKGARDARKLLRQAKSGGALAFFPEGTFGREPGLMRFRSGAFAIAARSRLPIVPVAIRGTRAALPAGTLLPWPGRIEIELAPVQPAPESTSDEHVHAALNSARAAILQRIPDPDLA